MERVNRCCMPIGAVRGAVCAVRAHCRPSTARARSSIAPSLRWLHWITPLPHIIKMLSANEFLSAGPGGRYDKLMPVGLGQVSAAANSQAPNSQAAGREGGRASRYRGACSRSRYRAACSVLFAPFSLLLCCCGRASLFARLGVWVCRHSSACTCTWQTRR